MFKILSSAAVVIGPLRDNIDLDIIRSYCGSQILYCGNDYFPIIPLKNCALITQFTNNKDHSYGSQT